MRWFVVAIATFGAFGAFGAACTGIVPRLPTDVQTSLAHDDMRRLETDQFIIYYPAARRAEIDRFLARADGCARQLRAESRVHERDHKMVLLMPDTPFNNAFVEPEALGYEDVAVIPLHSTLDFTTLFGLAPDPGLIACHELTHYVHGQQTAGFWAIFDGLFGSAYTPQLGYDPWFFEGLATHYETKLTGIGRPVWPIFTGMFAAAYAGKSISSGDLSSFGRLSPVGHHYLVGAMFFRFLGERYGDRALWATIADNADTITGWFWPGTFETGFGVSFGHLMDEFQTWVGKTFPVRHRPASQRALAVLGNEARYGRGRDGTEVWVSDDVDVPTHIVIRDPHGTTLLDKNLVEIIPPRTLVQASPLYISGLSVTADGSEVWLTALDNGGTYQVPRLLRWRRGEHDLTELADNLGPGATIDPTGKTYYYCHVDGDRWSLAAWDVATHKARTVVDMQPGSYVSGAQISADGTRLAANVWDGKAFAIWVVDTATGAVVERVYGPARTPVFDASFTSDGRLVHLGVVEGRFQIIVGGVTLTDVPYASLAPREANGTIRFLDREDWSWELGEVSTPERPATAPAAPAALAEVAPSPLASTALVQSDTAYSPFEHFFYPQLRTPSLAVGGGVPHLGIVLSGGDRLGLQRWAIAGYAQPTVDHVGDRTHYGAYAGYMNNMLAPVSIVAEATFLDWAAPLASDDPDVKINEERKTRDADVFLDYTWRDSLTVGAGASYTSDYQRVEAMPGDRLRVGGPSATLAWSAAETTRYTGPRRALYVTAETAYYPAQLSSFMGDITDIGGTLGGALPLPIGRRHTISAFVRGRSLVARQDTGLLQVGGDSALGLLWNRASVSTTPPEFDGARFPPNLRFVEPLRGYEDYAITTDAVALGELSWRYPLIIDQGIASLWFLPASYLRELDLELFGAGAIDAAHERHYDVGAATTLHVQFLRIPLVVTYQIARRLVDDRALTQLVGVGADLDL